MKKIIILAILLIIGFSACNVIAPIFQPIIGTWEATGVFGTTRQVYNLDGSCTEVNTLLDVSISKSGTWTSDTDTITRTWSDASTDTNYYSFNTDNSQMTLSADPIGLSVTFDRI